MAAAAFAARIGGASPDCNANAMPDECESDEDCNTNGVQDICDVAAGTSADCNANGRPDSCELSPVFVSASPRFSPVGYLYPHTYVVFAPPIALSDVTLYFEAIGDFASSGEYVNVDIDGTFVGRAFAAFGADCPPVPNTNQFTVPAALFNALAADGVAAINLVPISTVAAYQCNPETFISVRVTYDTIGDCDGNAVPDGCEPDCNLNHLADACDAPGDFDGSGAFDLSDLPAWANCQTSPCHAPPCDPPQYGDPCCLLADFDADGDVDLSDFALAQRAFAEGNP